MESKKYAKKIRQKLISKATPAELDFKEKLKSLGVSFVFQKVIFVDSFQFYVVDFYFPKTKLAIELDGYHHLDRAKEDLQRTKRLYSKLRKIKRFWNSEALSMTKKELKQLLWEEGLLK